MSSSLVSWRTFSIGDREGSLRGGRTSVPEVETGILEEGQELRRYEDGSGGEETL